ISILLQEHWTTLTHLSSSVLRGPLAGRQLPLSSPLWCIRLFLHAVLCALSNCLGLSSRDWCGNRGSNGRDLGNRSDGSYLRSGETGDSRINLRFIGL